jgi:DNA-directed RNA polymerase specialized sigma24 family protein
MLHFIACRVLGGPEYAEDAVRNCWRTASGTAPRFEYEGEFRGWLLRILIDEACAIRRERLQTRKPRFSRGSTRKQPIKANYQGIEVTP